MMVLMMVWVDVNLVDRWGLGYWLLRISAFIVLHKALVLSNRLNAMDMINK